MKGITLFYLSKILPVFVLPTGVALLLVVAGLVFRRKALCWIGIVVLWLGSMPLVGNQIMRAAEGWQMRQPASAAPQAEAIVVLSYGRIQPPGDPAISEWVDADRFYGGVELYKAGKAPLLIFTGGWVPRRPDAKPEGEILIQYAANLGIPLQHMLTTTKVTNTHEESRAVADLLRRRSGGSAAPRVLLVTSAFHMRRARMLLARAGLEPIPFAVDFKVSAQESFNALDLLPSAAGLNQSETALRELYGLAFYRLFGG